MQNSLAKKLFAVGLAASTVAWGLAPLAAKAAAHAAGTNVIKDGTVYMISTDGQRRPYTSAGAFLSYGFNSWSTVVEANADDMALAVGGFIPPQDGKVICSDRGTDQGTCYLITGAQKAGFTSAAVFTGLGFSFSRATMGDVSWMTSTSNLDSSTASHKAGVLVNNNGTVQLVGATGLLGIPDMATFNTWGYSFADVVTANAADKAMSQTGVMASRTPGQLSPTALAVVPPTTVTGTLTVAVASDSPAAGTLVQGQAIAPLAKFVFTNASGSEATVTGLKMKKLGVAADTTLPKVYLYDGEARLTDDAAVSSAIISWSNTSGLFKVPANGSKTITVKSNIAGSTSGQTVGVSVNAAADVTTNVSSVGGSFPVSGAIHTIASATLASFDFGTSVLPNANTSLDPQEGFTAWQNTVSVGTRAVYLKSMNFRVIGSIELKDIKNFKLLVDGAQFGSTVAQADANGYVLFDSASAPKKLEAGSRVFKVLADVIGGSNRNFQVSLRQAADINVTDSDFGSNILVRGDGSSTTNTFAEHITGLQTVPVGTLTIQKRTDSPSGNITDNATGVTLSKYDMKALGEKMKVENLRMAVVTSSNQDEFTLRNAQVYVDGVAVGSTFSVPATTDDTLAYYEVSLGSSVIVEPGTPKVLELKADIYDNDGSTDSTTAGLGITGRVAVGSTNVQRMVSAGYVSVPSAVQDGNQLTITTGSMTITKDQSYGNQSIVVPKVAYKLGQWVVTGSSTEDINLDTIMVDFTNGNSFVVGDMSNVYVKYGSKTTSIKGTVSATAGANTWSISELLAKNTSMTFEVYADIATDASNGGSDDTMIASLKVSGTTAGSGSAVNTNTDTVLAGQTITAEQSGTLRVTLDSGTPQAAIAVAGSTPADGATKVKLAATNEDLFVKDVTFRVDAQADDAVMASATLWKAEGSAAFTQVGIAKTWNADGDTNPGYVQWTLSGDDRIKVPKDGVVYLLVKPTYVSSSQATVTMQTPRLYLADLQAEGTSPMTPDDTSGGNNLVVEGGILVGSGTITFAADGTAIALGGDATAATQSITVGPDAPGGDAAPTIDRTGQFAFISQDDDATYDDGEEVIYVMEGGTGDATLAIQRGVLGTTAAAAQDGDKIYFLAGVNGNAMTVAKDKLTLSVASDSPTGATTGGTQRVIFKFNAAAANNAEDVAENKVVLTSVDITTTKSGLTVNNVKVYPSEYDQNATYVTTCIALSATEWRCTMATAGATNEIVENTSRTYIARADVGSGSGTSNTLDVSIASLGSSNAAGSVTAGDVVWTDATTSISWVNQSGASYIQPASPMTLGANSGTTDATRPVISTVNPTNVATSGTLDATDQIVIIFSERIDPSTINASLVPGGSTVTGVAAASTGGVVTAIPGGAGGGDDTITVTNILTLTVTSAAGATSFAGGSLALSSDGATLTVTVGTGTARVIDRTALGGAGIDTTIKDVSGNLLNTTAVATLGAGAF